jgi:hypothetical protein
MNGALSEQLQRCWALYRDGRLGDLARALPPAHGLYHEQLRSLDALTASNATVELAMLDVILNLVTAASVDDIARGGDDLAEMVIDPQARCDELHRLAAMSCAVHAAMRIGRLPLAQGRFRATLRQAQQSAEAGSGGELEMAQVGTVLGCAGLHLAQAAANAGEESLTRSLLDQSDQMAAGLGFEYEVLGQYFGPEHARAVRCICMAQLDQTQEALTAGEAVKVEMLIPLMGATVLRVLAELSEKSGEAAAAQSRRARADAIAAPLDQQFG